MKLLPIPEKTPGPFSRPIYPFEVEEIERTRAKLADPKSAEVKNGVYYWKSNGNVVPPWVFEEAYIECPPEQKAAREEESTRRIAEYRAQRAKHGYSEEEMFEMRAAFGPGETVVDCLTGKSIKL